MARGIFEQLDWLTNKYKQLCCKIDSCCNGGGGEPVVVNNPEDLQLAIDNNTLVPGQHYIIHGVNTNLYGGTTIMLHAVATNKISSDGWGLFYNPKYVSTVDPYGVYSEYIQFGIFDLDYNISNGDTVTSNLGDTGTYISAGLIIPTDGIVWSSGIEYITCDRTSSDYTVSIISQPTSYNVGDKVNWGGRVWENTSGNLGYSQDRYTLNSGDWDLVPYNDTDYNVVLDAITYDINNDYISSRKDINGNEVDATNLDYNNYFVDNPIKLFQWGNGNVFNNKMIDSYLECVNFRGNELANNTLTQISYVQSCIFETGSVFSQNILNQGSHLYSCKLSSQSAGIERNIFTRTTSIENNDISYYGYISDNNFDYSNIHNNIITNNAYFLESKFFETEVSENIFYYNTTFNVNSFSVCAVYNNYFRTSYIGHNTFSDSSYMNNNYSIDSTIQYNQVYGGAVDTSIYGGGTYYANISNNNLQNSALIQYNVLKSSQINSNLLNNSSKIQYNNITNSIGDQYDDDVLGIYSNDLDNNSNIMNNEISNYSGINDNDLGTIGDGIQSSISFCTVKEFSLITRNGFDNSSIFNADLSYSQIINTTFSGFSVGPAVVLNNSIWDFTNSGVLSGNQIFNTTSQGYVTTDISAASIIYQSFSKDIKIVDNFNSLKLIYWDSGSGAYLGTEIDN